MNHFDDETRLQPAAPNIWSGTVHPAWNIADNPNGGYLMSLAASALRQQTPHHPDPLSVTVQYLKPGLAGQTCEIDTRVLRSGRALSTARATLLQEGVARLELLAALGDLGTAAAAGGGPSATASASAPVSATRAPMLTVAPPDIPSPERCVGRSGDEQGVALPILDRLDIRLHPDEAQAGKAGRPQVSGWIRFLDGREPDPLALLLFADAFPPSVFGVLGAVGWVPTIELTVHVRRRPAPGWVLGQFRTADLADGRMIEDGWLWDSEGRLVAQSRQLALVRLR